MIRLRQFLGQYGTPGWIWALMFVILSRQFVWWGHIWLRSFLNAPARPFLTWTICILYFAVWVWLFLVLMADWRRYPGMVKDAVLGGSLLAVAAVLRDSDVSLVMARKGFGIAAWVSFLGAFGLLIRCCTSFSRKLTEKTETFHSSQSPK